MTALRMAVEYQQTEWECWLPSLTSPARGTIFIYDVFIMGFPHKIHIRLEQSGMNIGKGVEC